MRCLFNYTSAISSLLSGQPGFFQPRFIPPFLQPHGTSGALSVYDTSPLRTTLEALVDFDRINSGKTRLSLGAVNIRLGNFVYFEPPALTASAMRSKTEKAILDGFRTGAFSHSLDPQWNSARPYRQFHSVRERPGRVDGIAAAGYHPRLQAKKQLLFPDPVL